MRIGIIGSGMIGGTLTRLWAGLGHDVVVSNSRGPESLAALVAAAGDHASAATAAEAAAAGEVVVVAIPLGRYRQLPVDALAGKVVVDAMNYYPGRDGNMAELDAGTTGSSEMLAGLLGDARVVKAFNTIYFEHLRDQGTPPGTPARPRRWWPG